MSDRTTELESKLRQIHADQGGEATFAEFVEAVAGDPNEQGHEEAREFIGKLIISGIRGAFAAEERQDVGEVIFGALKALSGDAERAVYARNAQIDDLIHVSGQGKAVFKVTGRTQIDPPDNVASCARRSITTIAPQALQLLNNAFVERQARVFADRLRDEAGRERNAQLIRAFRLALGRVPTPKEMDESLTFLARQEQNNAAYGKEVLAKGADPAEVLTPEREALVDFCHALFNLNEFVYRN